MSSDFELLFSRLSDVEKEEDKLGEKRRLWEDVFSFTPRAVGQELCLNAPSAVDIIDDDYRFFNTLKTIQAIAQKGDQDELSLLSDTVLEDIDCIIDFASKLAKSVRAANSSFSTQDNAMNIVIRNLLDEIQQPFTRLPFHVRSSQPDFRYFLIRLPDPPCDKTPFIARDTQQRPTVLYRDVSNRCRAKTFQSELEAEQWYAHCRKQLTAAQNRRKPTLEWQACEIALLNSAAPSIYFDLERVAFSVTFKVEGNYQITESFAVKDNRFIQARRKAIGWLREMQNSRGVETDAPLLAKLEKQLWDWSKDLSFNEETAQEEDGSRIERYRRALDNVARLVS